MILLNRRKLTAVIFVFILFFIVGCQNAPISRLTEEEKLNLGNISIQPLSSSEDIKFGTLLTDNSTAAISIGAGSGFIIGFHPVLLMVGGPIFMPAIGGISLKDCADQLQQVEKPEIKFIKAVIETKPYENFTKKLAKKLVVYTSKPTLTENTPDTIINFDEFKITLEPVMNMNGSCLNAIKISINWTIKKTKDTQSILSGITEIESQHYTIDTLYSNNGKITKDVVQKLINDSVDNIKFRVR